MHTDEYDQFMDKIAPAPPCESIIACRFMTGCRYPLKTPGTPTSMNKILIEFIFRPKHRWLWHPPPRQRTALQGTVSSDKDENTVASSSSPTISSLSFHQPGDTVVEVGDCGGAISTDAKHEVSGGARPDSILFLFNFSY